MRIVMPSPWKHPKTGIWWYRVRVPADVAAAAKGRKVSVPVGADRREIILSEAAKVTLSTRDPAEAKARFVAVSEALGAFFESLRAGPITISFRQRQAIAGAIMEGLIASYEDEPGDAAQWRAMGDLLSRATTGDPETVLAGQELLVGSEVDNALAERNLTVTDDSRRALLHDATEAFGLFFRDIAAMADRDYSRRRYPVERGAAPESQKTPTKRKAKSGDDLTFLAIIEEEERRRSAGIGSKPLNPTTVKTFKRHAAAFAKFRGEGSALAVSRQELSEWMASLQEAGKINNRTIGHWLTNIQTIVRWGREQRPDLFPEQDNLVRLSRPGYSALPTSERAFTLDEARLILRSARTHTDPGIRWLPWLAAYSGGRIGELSALRKSDFRVVDGLDFYRITTSGKRTLKTASSERQIPIHPALKAEGLLEYVRSAPQEKLFKSNAHEDVSEWVRNDLKLTREGIRPSHSWRHLFEDALSVAGVPDDTRSYLTGRATGGSRDSYGRSDLALKGYFAAMSKVEPFLPE